jgi:hypothetical protein
MSLSVLTLQHNHLRNRQIVSTTSLEIPDELEERAIIAANELGITPQAFMIDAIRHAADAAEQRSKFVAQAVAARAEMLQSGLGVEQGIVRTYLRDRLSDEKAPRPDAKAWRK